MFAPGSLTSDICTRTSLSNTQTLYVNRKLWLVTNISLKLAKSRSCVLNRHISAKALILNKQAKYLWFRYGSDGNVANRFRPILGTSSCKSSRLLDMTYVQVWDDISIRDTKNNRISPDSREMGSANLSGNHRSSEIQHTWDKNERAK